MNGVVAIRQLLVNDAALVAIVPAARIVSGPLTQGVALPAISITSISTLDRNISSPGATRFVTERVQVTGYHSSYPAKKALLAAVKKALADQAPVVAGIANVTVHTDTAGPDFMDEQARIYMGSHDFRVKYTETR